MNDDALEIRCGDIAELEQEFPEEMSVVREMLCEIAEQYPETLAA